MSVNRVILLGHVGKDPEIRSMQNGKEVASFSLATSDYWKDKDGNKQTKTEWHSIVVFGNLVSVIKAYVKKGSKIYVEGALQTQKWTDNKGIDRYRTDVILQGFNCSLQMLDSKGSGDNSSPVETTKESSVVDGVYNDDIPF
jgi:single-strand DNA-binding protein